MAKRLIPALVLVLLTAACGDDDAATTTTTAETTSTAAPTTTGAGGAAVVVASFSFTPNEASIALGDTVTFTWESGTHTVTARDGSFASGSLSTGATFTASFATAGTYEYFCEFHQSMTGTITVAG